MLVLGFSNHSFPTTIYTSTILTLSKKTSCLCFVCPVQCQGDHQLSTTTRCTAGGRTHCPRPWRKDAEPETASFLSWMLCLLAWEPGHNGGSSVGGPALQVMSLRMRCTLTHEAHFRCRRSLAHSTLVPECVRHPKYEWVMLGIECRPDERA